MKISTRLQRLALLLVGLLVAWLIFKIHLENFKRLSTNKLINYVQ